MVCSYKKNLLLLKIRESKMELEEMLSLKVCPFTLMNGPLMTLCLLSRTSVISEQWESDNEMKGYVYFFFFLICVLQPFQEYHLCQAQLFSRGGQTRPVTGQDSSPVSALPIT